ncbi:hypothetical protein KY289_029783 [Solanum tuberosum]|nr:hypothetical protein KY289_029783 [Solanum tuberosum]
MAKSFAVFFSPFDHGRYGELVRTKIRSTCYNSKGFNSYGGFRCIWCYLYKSWQSAATKESIDASSPQVPLLMLSADKDDDYENFTLFPRRKLQAVFLPEAKGRVSFNTGMVCTVQYTAIGVMTLLRPFSHTQIQLPPHTSSKHTPILFLLFLCLFVLLLLLML